MPCTYSMCLRFKLHLLLLVKVSFKSSIVCITQSFSDCLPMHNFLLGTAKHVMSLWKDKGVLDGMQLELIQDKVDRMRIPSHIGRIPHNIA